MMHDTSQMVGEALAEMCRPVGSIEHWAVDWSADTVHEGLYRCAVRLEDPEMHDLVARHLGGEVREDEVFLEIRVRQ